MQKTHYRRAAARPAKTSKDVMLTRDLKKILSKEQNTRIGVFAAGFLVVTACIGMSIAARSDGPLATTGWLGLGLFMGAIAYARISASYNKAGQLKDKLAMLMQQQAKNAWPPRPSYERASILSALDNVAG